MLSNLVDGCYLKSEQNKNFFTHWIFITTGNVIKQISTHFRKVLLRKQLFTTEAHCYYFEFQSFAYKGINVPCLGQRHHIKTHINSSKFFQV